MPWHFFNVLVHLCTSVFLVGYSLFWTIVALRPPAGAPAGPEPAELLAGLARAEFPPAPLPSPVRMPLPMLGWGALAVLLVSGHFALAAQLAGKPHALGTVMVLKLVLVGLLAVAQLVLTLRPSARAVYALQALLLVVVTLSVAIAR